MRPKVQRGGVHHNYPDAIRPALEIVGAQKDKILAGVYMLLWESCSLFFADTTVNINPNAEQLAQIAIQTHAPQNCISLKRRELPW